MAIFNSYDSLSKGKVISDFKFPKDPRRAPVAPHRGDYLQGW